MINWRKYLREHYAFSLSLCHVMVEIVERESEEARIVTNLWL